MIGVILFFVVLILSVTLNVFLGYVSLRFSRRLLELDDLFGLFVHDIQVNTKYIDGLQHRPLMERSEEVQTMHKNIGIISKRLHEFAGRMGELTNKDVTKVEKGP